MLENLAQIVAQNKLPFELKNIFRSDWFKCNIQLLSKNQP
jgi:hypothetical protein